MLCAQERRLSYHGQLWDAAGAPFDAPTTLTLRLYLDPEGGDPLWEERHPEVEVVDGYFAISLGSITPLPEPEQFSSTLYLGLSVGEGEEQQP